MRPGRPRLLGCGGDDVERGLRGNLAPLDLGRRDGAIAADQAGETRKHRREKEQQFQVPSPDPALSPSAIVRGT